jgi:hypothetical protein
MPSIHEQLAIAAKEIERCRVEKERIWEAEGYGSNYQVALRAYEEAVNKCNDLVRHPYREQHL